MGSDEDIFPQEYFVYFKKKWQSQGTYFPKDAEAIYLEFAQKNKERRRGV